ncbi:hypothetical protein CR513_25201, partial [Mucuna pruriens]
MLNLLVPITKYCKLVHEAISPNREFKDLFRMKFLNRWTYQTLKAKDVLELIHTNICGPFPIASWNGQHYFIIFIDITLGTTFSSLLKLKLNFNLERKLKSSNLIMVVNIVVDMMDQENNMRGLLPFFLESVELFRNIPSQENLA